MDRKPLKRIHQMILLSAFQDVFSNSLTQTQTPQFHRREKGERRKRENPELHLTAQLAIQVSQDRSMRKSLRASKYPAKSLENSPLARLLDSNTFEWLKMSSMVKSNGRAFFQLAASPVDSLGKSKRLQLSVPSFYFHSWRSIQAQVQPFPLQELA